MIELNAATIAGGGLVERLNEEIRKAVANCLDIVLKEGGKMQYTLVEADGGAWRSEAIKNIKAYMEAAVQGLNVIA